MQGLPQADRPLATANAAAPPHLGKYEVVDRIGEGGFGVVYKGFDPLIQRFVAIKTCTSPDDELKQRYTREAQIAGQLDHPNIVRIFDFGTEAGTPFLVQEFLSGEDLDKKITNRAFVPQPERLLYLIHIARGLQYAHSKGVVHRDIKPANIRILEDGTAKIMDFGVATLQHSDTRLTAAGTTMGTAAYLAPEQIRGEKADGRTDIFSFGVLAYELVTGERPFSQETISAILYEILNDDPRPITLPPSVCPEGLRQLVFRCLEKEPGRRYPHCGEIIEALESIREDLKADTSPRDLTAALRKSSSPPLQRPESTGIDPSRIPAQAAREQDAFDPVIQHEWTPTGIAIPNRRLNFKRILISILAIAACGAGYAWLGLRGVAPWPEELPPSLPAGSSLVVAESGDSTQPTGAVEARASSSQPEPSDQNTPVSASTAGQEESQEVQPTSGTEVEDPGASEPATDAAASSHDDEPVPEPEVPLIVDATLTIAASWHPETTVSIDRGRPMELSRGRSLQLPPGDHRAVFSLSTPEYSSRQTVRLKLESGEQRTLRSPIQRPGQLTVQASLGSPQGLVAVDGNLVGSSPLRYKKLSPGAHRLELYPLEGATAPLATTQLQIQPSEETVVTFDLTGQQELSVRNRPGNNQ